jgi:fructose-bisphosphate aldolase class II
MDPAFEQRYGVAAFNVVDGVSLRAVIDAAVELESPLIVQTSVKTVKS